MPRTDAVLAHLRTLGLDAEPTLHHNLDAAALTRHALDRGEGRLTDHGVLYASTGAYTGRSPEDRFIVREPGTEAEVGWGKVNRPIDEAHFDALLARVLDHLGTRELFSIDAVAGADPRYRLPVRVVAEKAWHAQFAANMFIEPNGQYPEHDASMFAGDTPRGFTVLSACSFKADPERDGTRSDVFILLHLTRRLVLIGGTEYAGEIKKSIFSALNFLLPRHDVFPRHCSANTTGDAADGGVTAVFFGLSGTGKTTISADARRTLIGDDEHGWSADGVFNFEGGCYAKTIRLSPEGEPEIYAASQTPGSILENVIVDENGVVDYDSEVITPNTRVSYPIGFIPNASESGVAGHPQHVVFLTADAFGVLPPVAKLTPEQAMYHFLSGYTAKVAGTERGVKEPKATFSACFGGPFMVRPATDYASLLGERLREHGAHCWLVNTGWTGGPYGTGHRHHLAHTRAMIEAVLTGALDGAETMPEPIFGLAVPTSVPGVPSEILDTRSTWADTAAFDAQASALQRMFAENFEAFADSVSESVRQAGPRLEPAA